MATFKSGAVELNLGFTPQPDGVVGIRRGEYAVTAALAANDVIQLVNIFKGETVLGVILESPDLDTGGSPAIILDVGHGGDADSIIDGSTIGQTGGTQNSFNSNVAPITFSADDTIDVTVATSPTTGATSGVIKMTVLLSG